MAATYDQMMAQLLAGSLADGIEDSEGALAAFNRRQQFEETEQRARETAIVKAALDNPAGQAFLQWLARKTVLRGENDDERSASTCEAFTIAKAKRQGQNGLFFAIVEALSFDANREERREAPAGEGT